MADDSLLERLSDEEVEHISDKDEPYFDVSGHDLNEGDEKIMDRQAAVPQVGMVFKSYEEVRGFYDHYARLTGFGTKTKRSWYNEDGQLLKSVLACRKEGRAPDAPTYRSRPTAKTNCPANVKVELMPDNLLHLIEVNLEHNHAVSPLKARFFTSNRKLVNGLKRRLDKLAELGATSKEKYKLAMNLVREMKKKLLMDDDTSRNEQQENMPTLVNAREFNQNPSLEHAIAIGNTINGGADLSALLNSYESWKPNCFASRERRRHDSLVALAVNCRELFHLPTRMLLGSTAKYPAKSLRKGIQLFKLGIWIQMFLGLMPK
ncbi:hypothetical protein H6P81_017827 [Aristolochia fimbriata]|uniref:FAR1 domain-containing protein n=1 Tax=Aristolochia fimbriata TaxID=158543 RepID=A0AAV7E026_ARIFI|nr:hypothetical protein H6P81_017827 [Aristolochia fimbriata]